MDSIKKGKEEHDNQKVEDSLLKRALGYQFIETTKKLVPITIKEKDPVTGEERGLLLTKVFQELFRRFSVNSMKNCMA